MSEWFNNEIKLNGKMVKLISLASEHFDELLNACSEPIIWIHLPIPGNREALFDALTNAIMEQKKNLQYPFTIIEKKTGKIIGSTRLLKLNPEHRTLEIGWTWYLPSYWGKGYNDECKMLLLTYCFEVLKTIRVQICASEKNIRSRRAIERIGGRFEGILRNLVIRHDGIRNVACYSITDDEWTGVKKKLEQIVTEKASAG
jgi:N-acetyltransferase